LTEERCDQNQFDGKFRPRCQKIASWYFSGYRASVSEQQKSPRGVMTSIVNHTLRLPHGAIMGTHIIYQVGRMCIEQGEDILRPRAQRSG
jgi:hypothetical protein